MRNSPRICFVGHPYHYFAILKSIQLNVKFFKIYIHFWLYRHTVFIILLSFHHTEIICVSWSMLFSLFSLCGSSVDRSLIALVMIVFTKLQIFIFIYLKLKRVYLRLMNYNFRLLMAVFSLMKKSFETENN